MHRKESTMTFSDRSINSACSDNDVFYSTRSDTLPDDVQRQLRDIEFYFSTNNLALRDVDEDDINDEIEDDHTNGEIKDDQKMRDEETVIVVDKDRQEIPSEEDIEIKKIVTEGDKMNGVNPVSPLKGLVDAASHPRFQTSLRDLFIDDPKNLRSDTISSKKQNKHRDLEGIESINNRINFDKADTDGDAEKNEGEKGKICSIEEDERFQIIDQDTGKKFDVRDMEKINSCDINVTYSLFPSKLELQKTLVSNIAENIVDDCHSSEISGCTSDNLDKKKMKKKKKKKINLLKRGVKGVKRRMHEKKDSTITSPPVSPVESSTTIDIPKVVIQNCDTESIANSLITTNHSSIQSQSEDDDESGDNVYDSECGKKSQFRRISKMYRGKSSKKKTNASGFCERGDTMSCNDGNSSRASTLSTVRSIPLPRNAVPVYCKGKKQASSIFNPLLSIRTEVKAHDGPIWKAAFSIDGKYYATGGSDGVINLWEMYPIRGNDQREWTDKKENGIIDKDKVSIIDEDKVSIPGDPSCSTWGKSVSVPDRRRSPVQQEKTNSLSGEDLDVSQESGIMDSMTPLDGVKSDISAFHSTAFRSVYNHTRKPALACEIPLLSTYPLQRFIDHTKDVADLSWSATNFLLSASLDKTVRLWHPSRSVCLKIFRHADIISSVSFNPIDDRYFVSGGFDQKLRVWSVTDGRVKDWAQTPDYISTTRYTPDGRYVTVGCFDGRVLFYLSEGLKYFTQVSCKNRRQKIGSKVTGISFPTKLWPNDDKNRKNSSNGGRDRRLREQMLISSNDSRIRLLSVHDFCMIQKYKGIANSSLQIKAHFSESGKYLE